MKSTAFLLSLSFLLTSCANFLGNLRQDLDDTSGSQAYNSDPTTGGRWAERGFLADDMGENGYGGDNRYAAVGHSERAPASMSSSSGGNGSWVSQDQADANRRDQMRGQDDDQQGQAYSPDGNVQPPVKRQYKNGDRATRADFVDDSQSEGSLWASGGQTNYYFTKNKIRGVGDIVTINLEQDLVRDIGLEVKRTLTPRERDIEMGLAQDRIRNRTLYGNDAGPNASTIAAGAAAPDRTPAAATDGNNPVAAVVAAADKIIPLATYNDVDVSRALEIKTGDTMMAEVVDRYPNGNYKIRGVKRIPYKNGAPRMVSVVGIAQSTDIDEQDNIKSGKIYEYRIEALR